MPAQTCEHSLPRRGEIPQLGAISMPYGHWRNAGCKPSTKHQSNSVSGRNLGDTPRFNAELNYLTVHYGAAQPFCRKNLETTLYKPLTQRVKRAAIL